MRLSCVDHGHTPELRERLESMRRGGMEPPGVVKTLLYRPDLLGSQLSDLTQEAMRGPSEWSPGERELFAAFVSNRNQCPF